MEIHSSVVRLISITIFFTSSSAEQVILPMGRISRLLSSLSRVSTLTYTVDFLNRTVNGKGFQAAWLDVAVLFFLFGIFLFFLIRLFIWSKVPGY